MIDLEFVPHRAALLAGQDNGLDVVLRAKAPAAANTQRERVPLNLAIVIDRSGSMSGRPLAEAKRCAAMIVDGLSTQDHAASLLMTASWMCWWRRGRSTTRSSSAAPSRWLKAAA